MANKDILITQDGLEKLQNELAELTKIRRPDVVNRIKTAKELGDLSENAEYTSAKEEQSFIEGRIQEIEQTLKHAKVVEGKHSGTISIGSKVEVVVDGETDKFELVGQTESDPENGKISVDSPVGRALLGHKTKDKVSVETPDGAVVYSINSVE
ncbi:MAG: transcription elongation factor GreA [Patescibacteria group bacterium]